MAQSIHNTVCLINNSLENSFKGAKFYGIATPVGKEGKYQPIVKERSVSFDDSYAMQVYHKVNGLTISYKKGFGRETDTVNTFAMSAIVFNNEKKTKLRSDELAIIIQSLISNITTAESITPTNIILNSEAIFSAEYRGHIYALPEYMSLIQFNYTIALTYKGRCFEICPEDFSHC